MQRRIEFSEGEFYHIYNRGAGKAKIFVSDIDRDRFCKLFFACNSVESFTFRLIKDLSFSEIDRGETLVDIGAYCLMPNHFHILLRAKSTESVTIFMRKFLTAYSMYFNNKYNRTGVLFQGRFKATHVNNDAYLKYLFSYIHLNPIKLIDVKWKENGISDRAKAEKYLERYQYSSYLDYLGEYREESIILKKKAFPEYFENVTSFKKCTREWLSFKNSSSLPRTVLGK